MKSRLKELAHRHAKANTGQLVETLVRALRPEDVDKARFILEEIFVDTWAGAFVSGVKVTLARPVQMARYMEEEDGHLEN